jgi:hypothetical protein
MDSRQMTAVAGALSVRLAALGGAVYFVLVIIYTNLISGSPSATDSRQEIFDYVARHQERPSPLRGGRSCLDP